MAVAAVAAVAEVELAEMEEVAVLKLAGVAVMRGQVPVTAETGAAVMQGLASGCVGTLPVVVAPMPACRMMAGKV